MSENKRVPLTMRIEARVKKALYDIALSEHRTMTNMLEKLVLDYYQKNLGEYPVDRDL
jgi:hypothetical protein